MSVAPQQEAELTAGEPAPVERALSRPSPSDPQRGGESLLRGLDGQRAGWVQAGWDRVTPDRLRAAVVSLTDIASPTGHELALATHLAAELQAAGVAAQVQPLDDKQANALGRVRGDGTGPDLLLYAPIDTLTAGRADADVPGVGPTLRPDLLPLAHDPAPGPSGASSWVSGLGASNPKGHAACVLVAGQVLAEAGVPLTGDLLLGFGAGGMPTNALHLDGDPRAHTGQGVGCSFLVEQGGWADAAVIAKPGWTVAHEEVGLAWFDVVVSGTHTYVGSRHRLPYRNPIVDAAHVVTRLEQWFPTWTRAHTDGLVAPQAIVAAVAAGWMRMASVTPAQARIRVDLRLSPRCSPSQARRELEAALDVLRGEDPGLAVTCEPVLAIPGTSTDPAHPLGAVCRQAWEAFEGRPHQDLIGTSGATDANILRSRGIPTMRVGMPKVSGTPFDVDFAMGMNTVDVTEMARLTRYLVRVAVDVCTRDREELT